MGLLANLIVQFQGQGQNELKSDFDALKRKLEDMGDAGETVSVELKKQFRELGREVEANTKAAEKSKAAWQSVADVAGIAFRVATSTITGFVRAGMQGTVQSEMLNFSLQQLSREVAALFLPAIETAIDVVHQLVGWFQRLDGATQSVIGKMLLWGGVIGVVVTVVPKVITAVQAMITVFRGLGVAIAFVKALMGNWATVAMALAATAGVAAGIGAIMSSGGSGGGSGSDHMSLGMSGGRTESIRGTYDRIQAAALKTGSEKNYAEETAKNTANTYEQLGAIYSESQATNDLLRDIREKKTVA